MSREVLIKLLIKMALANSEHFTPPSTVLAPEMHCLVTHDSPKRQTLALAPFHRWGAWSLKPIGHLHYSFGLEQDSDPSLSDPRAEPSPFLVLP